MLPANPQSLNLPRPVSVSLNKRSTVQCVARQSRPPVRILVAVNGQLIADESKYSTEIVQKAIPSPYAEPAPMSAQPLVISSPAHIRVEDMQKSFYDTITNVTLSDVTMAMHNHSVECFVYSFMGREVGLESPDHRQNASLPEVESLRRNSMNTKSWLQVNYAPEVKLDFVTSAHKVLKEEEVISVECASRAIPAIHSYRWFIGDALLPGVLGSSLNLKLRKEMHLKTVTCEATNAVAAVKASLQLNILFKPAFVKGAQSFMLIERDSCNKPLTLDCHVTANPTANVTWYRRRHRRLSHNLYRFVTSQESSHSSQRRLDYSKLKALSLNDDYYDELIGTGSTYTVASFNCANKLANQTRRFSGNKNKNKKRSAGLANSELTTDKGGQEDYAYFDQEDYADYEPGQADLLADNGNINFDFSHRADRAKQPSEQELDDFGVYICEASNEFALEHGKLEERVSKRYIKINPVGPPILRILPQQRHKSPKSEAESGTVMVPEGVGATAGSEATSSLGDSVALTCLIEPLPAVHTIVWLNEHGKILPNSKYSLFESVQSSDLGFDTTESSGGSSKKQARNLSVQYENLAAAGASADSAAARTDAGVMKSVLYIKNVRAQDLGVYRCVASNAEGSSSASVLLREATFLDGINMNDSLVFTATLSAILAICALLLLTCLCVVSRRAREACCCYCCLLGSYSLGHRRCHKEKELLSHNSNCTEQHSDKTINDWLASSKLSNDTSGSSLINVAAAGYNNASTITAATMLNGLNEHAGCLANLHNTLSKASRAQPARCHMLSTPLQLRRDLANGNCSSLLNSDDLDVDEPTCSNEALASDRRRHLGLLNDPLEFNTFSGSNANNANKRDELKLSSSAAAPSTNYYSSFNRFMVSSPLLSNASSSPHDSNHSGSHQVSPAADPNSTNPELLHSVGTAAIAKTLHMPPMMTIRSQNIPNGNFNAKITAGTFASPMDSNNSNNSGTRPQFNTFTLSRKMSEANKYSQESPLYDNPKGSASDLSKLLQDNNFRFADLFNELSPNLVQPSSTNTTNSTGTNGQNSTGTLPKKASLYAANRAFQSALPAKKPAAMSLFQQFPSISSSPKHSPTSAATTTAQQPNVRQNLLQPTMSAATQLQMNSSFNKFPNSSYDTAGEPAKSSSTSKFYNNFYRKPSLRTADSDNCK